MVVMGEKYVLMDIEDKKSKEIATVLNSKASKKILEFLYAVIRR